MVRIMNKKIKYIDATSTEYICDSIINTNDEYSINDCVIVRTTDVFPFDGIVQTPINGNAYEFKSSTYFNDIIVKMLKDKYPNHYMDEMEEEKFSEEFNKYKVVFEILRSTIHFTINGLVGSTAYGNFDNKPFVIIDPLKYHINNHMKSLRVEDVYFDSDLSLSDECAIVIDEDTYNKIPNDPRYINDLSRFKVYVYKGDQQKAVAFALNDMGYDSFSVSSHGYVNETEDNSRASKLAKFIDKFAKENNISQEKHFSSEINYQDALVRNKKNEEINMMYLMHILNSAMTSSEVIDKIKIMIEYRQDITDILDSIVKQIGFEKLKLLTQEFNKEYIERLQKGKNSKTI